MPTRTSSARWQGSLQDGHGQVRTKRGTFRHDYSFASRFESADGTNPEELVAAAHAGCYAMYLSLVLGREGFEPDRIDADADVTVREVDGAPTLTRSELTVRAKVPGVDAADFARFAEEAKTGCPVSRALAGLEITLDAALVD